jgi:hypothetical protein
VEKQLLVLAGVYNNNKKLALVPNPTYIPTQIAKNNNMKD